MLGSVPCVQYPLDNMQQLCNGGMLLSLLYPKDTGDLGE